jgi:hypothetical protein
MNIIKEIQRRWGLDKAERKEEEYRFCCQCKRIMKTVDGKRRGYCKCIGGIDLTKEQFYEMKKYGIEDMSEPSETDEFHHIDIFGRVIDRARRELMDERGNR